MVKRQLLIFLPPLCELVQQSQGQLAGAIYSPDKVFLFTRFYPAPDWFCKKISISSLKKFAYQRKHRPNFMKGYRQKVNSIHCFKRKPLKSTAYLIIATEGSAPRVHCSSSHWIESQMVHC